MSESSLREAIARVIFRGQWQDPESEFAKQKWVKFKELYLADADAVLAVLADPPAEVIEQAALAWLLNGPTPARYEPVSARIRWLTESRMHATFAAVFGGEQS